MKLALRVLALLAVLLSPLAMLAPSHAVAMPAAAAPPAAMTHDMAARHESAAPDHKAGTRHCAPGENDEAPGRSPDCAIACAALPAGEAGLKVGAPMAAMVAPLPAAAEPHGLAPEAATPPPRSA